jgi:hypothetical protein
VEKEKNHRENTEARIHREEEEGRRKQPLRWGERERKKGLLKHKQQRNMVIK